MTRSVNDPLLTLRTAGCILFKRVDQKALAMNVLTNRLILDEDNPLWRKAHPVLLQIFCRGVQAAESKQLILGALISIAMRPVTLVTAIFFNAIHIAILMAVWWFLRDYIAEFGSLDYVILTVGMIAIFYKDIYDSLLDLLLYILVLITGGRFLRWMCTGYLSGTPFRQNILTKNEGMAAFVAGMVAVIPRQFRDKYDEIMDLYLDSNKPGNEDKLNRILEEHSQ